MIKIDEKNMGVYGIYTSKNLCLYVGCSRNINNRYTKHVGSLLLKKHSNTELQRFSDYYGFENLVFKTILYCDEKDLLYYESLFIKLFNPVANCTKTNKTELHEINKYDDNDYKIIFDHINNSEKLSVYKTKNIIDEIFEKYQVKVTAKKVGNVLNVKGYKSKQRSNGERVFVKIC